MPRWYATIDVCTVEDAMHECTKYGIRVKVVEERGPAGGAPVVRVYHPRRRVLGAFLKRHHYETRSEKVQPPSHRSVGECAAEVERVRAEGCMKQADPSGVLRRAVVLREQVFERTVAFGLEQYTPKMYERYLSSRRAYNRVAELGTRLLERGLAG